ncbi:uncharacterized protein [Haliotis asinina]|uniref:uncharacterized protein n=1 Tax=Haliotis asinina TaxID=109174 RepID=UPI003531C778
MGYARITITRLMQRLRQRGHTSNRPRSGRPRVTTRGEGRYILVIHPRNRTATATSTVATSLGHRISRQTVYSRLRQYGIRPRHPNCGPLLTPRYRHDRLMWARRVRLLIFRNNRRQLIFRRVVIRNSCKSECASYRDDILRPVVAPFLQQQPRGIIFQQDNARPLHSKIDTVLPVNVQDLERCLLEEWQRITPNVISPQACSGVY